MPETLSILPKEKPDLLSISGEQSASLSPKIAQERAAKVTFTDPSFPTDTVQNAIFTGGEGAIRKQMVIKKDLEFRSQKMDFVREYARQKQGPVSDEETQFILGLSKDQVSNPDTIFESEYSKKFINSVASREVGTRALEESPEEAHEALDVGEYALARKEIALTKLQDLEAKWSQYGLAATGYEYLETFLPFFSWSNMSGALEEAKPTAFLPGDNLKQQVEYLYLLPPDEFQKVFSETVDRIASSNMLDALHFAQAVTGYASSDAYLDNAFALGDILDVATLGVVGTGAKLAGKGALKGLKAASRGAKMVTERIASENGVTTITTDSLTAINKLKIQLKDALKAGGKRTTNVEDVLEAVGDVEAASKVRALKKIKSEIVERDPGTQMRELRQATPSIFNPESFTAGMDLTRERTQRILSKLRDNSEGLLRSVAKTTNLTRLGDDALVRGVERTSELLAEQYKHVNDSILDVAYNPAEDHLANTHSVSILIGTPDAQLFKTRLQAAHYGEGQYGIPSDNFRVRERGDGFYIEVTKDIDETDPSVRSLLIDTTNETPKTFMNTFLGFLRNPDDTLSPLQRENRKASVHGAQELHRLIHDTAKNIEALPKKSHRDLSRVFKANQSQIDPVTGDEGRFYTTVPEFDQEFKSIVGRYPTEKETVAYFSYVQLSDIEYIIRNLGLYRDKARQGIEEVKFFFREHLPSGSVQRKSSKSFDGKVVDDIPWEHPEDVGIYVYDNASDRGSFYRRSEMPGEARQDIESKLRDRGYKVIQVANPVEKPLSEFAGTQETINFLVVRDFQASRLKFQQLPRRAGGHKEYVSPFFTKQAKIRRAARPDGSARNIYEGDTVAFPHSSEAEAKKFSARMEKARGLLLAGDDQALGEFLSKNLPYDLEKFKNLFDELVSPDGEVIPARYSKNDPFFSVPAGQGVNDIHPLKDRYVNFEDEIDSDFNLFRNIDKKYGGQRQADLPAIAESGTEANPVFKLEKPKLIDPLPAMNRAMTNIMRSRYMNDYKLYSMESWIEEFADVMKPSKEELRARPLDHLHAPQWEEQTKDRAKLAAAKNARRAILNLLGTKSPLASNIEWVQQKLLNSVYGKFGKETTEWVSEHMLPTVSDPFRYTRQIAFHSKLGLFNPVQLFLQAHTFVHIAALSPKNAGHGLAAGYLFRTLSLTNDDSVISHVAEIATRLGPASWKKEDFLESYKAFQRTGLYNVEGEVGQLDDTLEPKMFQSKVGKFLDKGTFFFKEGERLVRLTAWNTAFREWKLKNPHKVPNQRDINRILLRQDDLSGNMTRNSNASWQQGILSVPTQFFGYQVRLMEQFMGKRLTAAEKARAFSVYSLWFGVPTALGAATAIPFYDDFKQALLERGIDTNDASIEALMDGIPALVFEMITGKDYNYSERYGPGGLSILTEIARGDKTVADLLVGASGSILGDIVQSAEPALAGLSSIFSDDESDYPVLAADFIDFSENISSVSQALKMFYALNTGRYLSKSETYLDDVTPFDAVMMGMTGVSPQEVSDTFIMIQSMKEQKEAQDEAQRIFTKNIRRGLQEVQAGNDNQAGKYFRAAGAARIAGGFKPTDSGRLLAQALDGQVSLVDKIRQDFWMKAKENQIKARLEATLKAAKKAGNQ